MSKPSRQYSTDEVEICYLCGRRLRSSITRDHVPPKQIYPGPIRKRHRPNLFTLPVNRGCNQSYQGDEEYFVQTMAPLVGDTYAGRALWDDVRKKWQRPEGRRLFEVITREYDRIILPGGLASKTCDAQRVRRVMWKITRGLFFKEERRFLAQWRSRGVMILSPEEKPPDVFGPLLATEPKGRYPAVFDYKFAHASGSSGCHLWVWAMLFWDRIITFVAFHDAVCACPECRPEWKHHP